MKKNLLLVSLLSAIILLTSCATIFTGTKDEISFTSTPEGAMVYIDGIEVCRTPCQANIKRKTFGSDQKVEFKLDNYETRVFKLDKKFNIISVLNLGNFVGWGIDALTGSIMQYDRKHYSVQMKKLKRTLSMEQPLKIEIDTQGKKVDVYVVENVK